MHFYTICLTSNETKVSKRIILSIIAQLFDPLGLLGPVIVFAKILMQSLCSLKLDWDESVSQEFHTTWINYRDQLKVLEQLKINRKIVAPNSMSFQIHGFADASEKAYGACIYIRSTNENGTHSTELVCSKSRVAPIKQLTIALICVT